MVWISADKLLFIARVEYNKNMEHKAVFFNLVRMGVGGREHLERSEKLKEVGVTVTFMESALTKDLLPQIAENEIVGVFMDSKIDADVFAALPNLKFLTTLSTGFDHIDMKAAEAKGIVVSSVPAYGENTVAEFAFALLLALSRKIREASHRVQEEGKFNTDGLRGFDLHGKTIGVIGTGRIGKHAVRMAKGFGMKVVAYDAYQDDVFAKDMDFPYVSLNDLLAQSDVITIHCPHVPETHHLINEQNIFQIKHGAYLINTARGPIVETAALTKALRSGILAGAGLDVLEEEDVLRGGVTAVDADIIRMPNVIVTPHNAFNTDEAFMRILDTTIENIVAYTKGVPINLVPHP
jgi:D-lactate dehydrogenase